MMQDKTSDELQDDFEASIEEERDFIEKLRKYVSRFYSNTQVLIPKGNPKVFRIFVPEASRMFVLGLAQFDVTVNLIVPESENRIIISVTRNS